MWEIRRVEDKSNGVQDAGYWNAARRINQMIQCVILFQMQFATPFIASVILSTTKSSPALLPKVKCEKA